MRNNYIDDPTNDPASESVEGVMIVGDDTNDSTDLMLDQSTEILDDESTLLGKMLISIYYNIYPEWL